MSARVRWISIITALGLAACPGRPDTPPQRAATPPPQAETSAAAPGPTRTGGQPATDPCAAVPGDLVASTLDGRLIDVRPFDGGTFRRCTYSLTAADGSGRRTFVIYFNPADDYDGLRAAHDGPVQEEPGLGAKAHMYRDTDTRRYWITTVKLDRVTLQVTGDSLTEVRKLAALALGRF